MTATDDDNHLQPLVAAELRVLADFLDGASEAQWDTTSLCEGWRVREVVAHTTMAARYSEEAFMAELASCGYDFTRLSNVIATRDADLPIAGLLADLRSDTMQRWAPPGGGYHGALNHVVVHGLDITAALGAPRLGSDDTMRIVLDDLGPGGGHRHFGMDLDGRRLEATDLAWAHGTGAMLRADAADLTLLLCGRAVPPSRHTGSPLERTSAAQ